jgi:SpoVK/Ycf46/Vps4 family AAA+-type ATPase
VTTVEESRAVGAIRTASEATGRRCIGWDIGSGFVALSAGAAPSISDPSAALDHIIRSSDDDMTVYVLKDFHEFWNDILVKRRLRNTAQALRRKRASIVVTSVTAKIPCELSDEAVLLEFALPTEAELAESLETLFATSRVKVDLTKLGRRKLVQAAVGLTRAEAERALSKIIVTDRKVGDDAIDVVNEEKKAIIRESEALEFYPAHETPDDVGGLEVLKDWLRLRERAFSVEAADYGLPAPKGIALIGIPGTGKSLTAKMIGGLWRVPLLRLDVGALFGSLVGESEERVRTALRLTETIAPCVLWIDELEKSLSTGGVDGGTSQRVLGTVLTWMQDKNAPVFVVATANDISTLPPEMLRRGRFDEVFFLDLPTEQERRDILAVHLSKRRRLAAEFDLSRLGKASAGFVGAEIEQAIVDAMFLAFNADRDITTDDIEAALRRGVPLSRSQREVVESLRDWLRQGRAQSASFQEKVLAENEFVPLEY